MRNTVFSGVATMAFLFTGAMAVAQDSKTPAELPAPSSGKAVVCIYRVYRFTGSASHDELYVNGTHLAKLLNSEYAFVEVPPGTVVISGLPKDVLRKRHHVRRGGPQSGQAERKRAGPV